MSDFPKLETERLVLREILPADAGRLLAIHGDADTMKWYGNDPLLDMQQALQLVQNFAAWRDLPNPGTRWGIQVMGEWALVGSCGLFKFNRGWRCCTIGYELASSVRGHGYMQEALSAIINWGWREMALHRIEAQVHPDNLASLRLLQRLGFRHEGYLRQAGFWGGRYHDLLVLGLLQQDWSADA
jgi:[ribosomal protein S5]-alanine N-acetyltransferase